VIFTGYNVIQFNLYCLVTKTEARSAQTAAGTVSFGTEEYQSTNLFLIQSTNNNSQYHSNTHRNILLP
jgi:hypothetical protein